MKFSKVSIATLVVLSVLLAQLGEISAKHAHSDASDAKLKVERGSFPKGFVFGTATAAYQVLFLYFLDPVIMLLPNSFNLSRLQGSE